MILFRGFVLCFVFVLAFANASDTSTSENRIVKIVAESGDNIVPKYASPRRQESTNLRENVISGSESGSSLEIVDRPQLSARTRFSVLRKFRHYRDYLFSSFKSFLTLPAKKAMDIADYMCNHVMNNKRYQPDITPDKESMGLILQLYKKKWWGFSFFSAFTATLSEPEKLLKDYAFLHDRPLVILATGWFTNHVDNKPNPTWDSLFDAFSSRRFDFNFVTLNSARYVDSFYSWSAFNTERVGEMLGEAIERIVEKGYPMEKIHLVGHSLGAHIVGYAGRYIRRKTGRMLPRITGLDPANPCFNTGIGLSKEDAAFVDVIHSNSGVLGKSDPTGHVDFYPNGLIPIPPGCFTVVCAHFYSVEIFAESVREGNENNFIAMRCEDFESMPQSCSKDFGEAAMGLAARNTTRGIYYMKVNGSSPYGTKPQ